MRYYNEHIDGILVQVIETTRHDEYLEFSPAVYLQYDTVNNASLDTVARALDVLDSLGIDIRLPLAYKHRDGSTPDIISNILFQASSSARHTRLDVFDLILSRYRLSPAHLTDINKCFVSSQSLKQTGLLYTSILPDDDEKSVYILNSLLCHCNKHIPSTFLKNLLEEAYFSLFLPQARTKARKCLQSWITRMECIENNQHLIMNAGFDPVGMDFSDMEDLLDVVTVKQKQSLLYKVWARLKLKYELLITKHRKMA